MKYQPAVCVISIEGCAPPPGSYEIKPEDLKGPASFEKSDRFRNAKAGG